MVNEYNEISYAKKMLNSGFLTNRRMYELNILAKYFYYIGYKPKEVKTKVIEFCNTHFENFNEAKYFDKIESILANAKKNSIVEVGSISITDKEIEFIQSLKETNKFNEVLFCLMVIKHIREKLGQQTYLNCKYSKFSKMCGLSSTKAIYPILRRMEELGLIRICRNSNVEILFNVNTTHGKPILAVNDFDNICAYYRNYTGKSRYIECQSCGKMVRVSGKWRRYCKACYAEKHRESAREYERKKYYEEKP